MLHANFLHAKLYADLLILSHMVMKGDIKTGCGRATVIRDSEKHKKLRRQGIGEG